MTRTGWCWASAWRISSASASACGTRSTGPVSDVFGVGTFDRPWLAPGQDPLTAAEAKLDAAFEFIAKLGVPGLLLPRSRRRPRRRDVRRDESPSRAHRRSHRGAYGAHRREAAVGHREPVQPSSLRGRRSDQPGSGDLCVRGRAGQTGPRGDAPAEGRELRACGAAEKATRPCSTRTSPARRPSSRDSSPWSPNTSTRSASTAPCSSSPSRMSQPSTSTTTTAPPSTGSSPATASTASID